MFTVGLPVISQSFFMLMTMLIAIPTGIKIFNWAGTLWGGHLQFKTPLLFALGFLTMFVIGGISGVYSAVVPVDYQLHDTYFIVGHIHYVLFGGSVFARLRGHLLLVPQGHRAAVQREPGRLALLVDDHRLQPDVLPDAHPGRAGHAAPHRRPIPIETGFLPWNIVETVGAFLLGFSMLIFLWNAMVSWSRGARGGQRPVAGQHPGMADHLAAARLQLRHPAAYRSERPLRDLRLAACERRPARAQRPGSPGER